MKSPGLLSLLLTLSLSFPAFAQLAWDDVGGDNLWSNTANWDPDGTVAGQDLTFGATGTATGATPTAAGVTNIVSGSPTVSSLSYINTGANIWHVTEIGAGQVLTLNKASGNVILVGDSTNNMTPTNAAITGAGSLVISAAAANILITNGGTTSQRATLDLSGLANFTASVNQLNLGSTGKGVGTLTLAATSSITANVINAGGPTTASTTAGTVNNFNLGANTTLSADAINVAVGYSSSVMTFRSAAGSTVNIFAKNGTDRADFSVGNTGSVATGNAQSGNANFNGGTFNAHLDDFLVGRRASGAANGTYTATFSMNAGTVDATTLTIGRLENTNAVVAALNATVNIGGGSVTADSVNVGYAGKVSGTSSGTGTAALNISGSAVVNVTNDLLIGRRIGTDTTTLTASVTVSGTSTLTVGGSLTESDAGGTASTTFNLSGGTLNMTGGAVIVDTFNITSGALENAPSIQANVQVNGAGAGLASLSGDLNLTSLSSLSFTLGSTSDQLDLTGSTALAGANLGVTVANGASFSVGQSFTLIDNDAVETIGGLFGTVNAGAFGAGDTFVVANDLATYEFALQYDGGNGNDLVAQVMQVTPVPEPSIPALAALGLLPRLRRRRR